ncbi:MAG: tetratricopeptide repeat protein [Chthoniobacterales bacterium]
MKKIGLFLLAGFHFFNAPPLLKAQSEDPSEVFLKAYMTSQQGEKLEHDNQLQPAIAKFRFAGSLLEELRKTHGDWQQAIVEYRSRKIGESILRVQTKISTQKDLAATSEPPPTAPPAVPIGEPLSPPDLPAIAGPPEPSVDVRTARPGEVPMQMSAEETRAPASTDTAIKEAAKSLHEKVDQLQAELQKSRAEYSSVSEEKTLATRLQDSNTKLAKAQGELEKTLGTDKELRGELATAHESLKKNEEGDTATAKAQEALRAEIGRLKKALTSAEESRVTAEQGKNVASEKLTEANKEIASVRKEWNEMNERFEAGKQAQERIQALVRENSNLKQKLTDAEKTVREISEEKPKKEQEVADVKRQLEQLRQQIATGQKQNQAFEVTIADLRSQLDEASSELNKAKLTGANPEETGRLSKENDILRRIVVRERQEEARRDQTKKLMLAEFDKLRIKSETLNQHIELLAQPVTKLSREELALLRQPVVALSDSNPAALQASFTVVKQRAAPPPADADRFVTSPPPEDRQPGGAALQTTPRPAVPQEVATLARKAKENFDNGEYRAAKKQYKQILAKNPNNVYSLSNLGVVYFRTGELKAAESTLKKVITLAPGDEFSHRTLGIVYYRQRKFDEAVFELTKALAINPKSFIAHNYLGVAASQKGLQEAAQREMLEAIAANPEYADAHYNLAVIYATAQPPAKELAKEHYAKATSLGARVDPSLEELIR